MDFSESYKASLPPVYSPSGQYCAVAVEYRLIVRDVESLRVVQLYSCLDRITQVDWSSNSLYVLCSQSQRAIIQVWAVDDATWTCKIDEGPAGVARTLWAPDGISVLVLAQFNIRLTVWNLMDRRCTYLRGPKHAAAGLAFSKDGRHMAVLERYDLRDHVTVYDALSWQQLSHFQCDTSDAADLAWCPDGTSVAVWDSCLAHRVQVLSVEGRQLAGFSAGAGSAAGMGIKACCWNAGGQLLAVGSYDQVCRVLNHVTWQPLLECAHPEAVDGPQHVVAYREVPDDIKAGAALPGTPPRSPIATLQGRTKYVIDELPAKVPAEALGDGQPLKLGVGTVRWSPDSQFLATVNDSQPRAVWVWDLAAMELSAVLLHQHPVCDVQWAPQGCTLAAVTSSSKVYMWTPGGASVVFIPLKAFRARHLVWGPNSASFLLGDHDAFCCAYIAS